MDYNFNDWVKVKLTEAGRKELKRLWWRVRYCYWFRKLAGVPPSMCWGPSLESLENWDFDTSECPQDAVREELTYWGD